MYISNVRWNWKKTPRFPLPHSERSSTKQDNTRVSACSDHSDNVGAAATAESWCWRGAGPWLAACLAAPASSSSLVTAEESAAQPADAQHIGVSHTLPWTRSCSSRGVAPPPKGNPLAWLWPSLTTTKALATTTSAACAALHNLRRVQTNGFVFLF